MVIYQNGIMTKNYTVVKPYHDSRIVFAGFNSCNIEKKEM